MTRLDRPVKRESYATSYEQCRTRPIVVSLEPPALLGFRLKGTRRTYHLPVETAYMMAVRAHVAAEKRAKAERKKSA